MSTSGNPSAVDVPVYPATYSGIPERLIGKAVKEKARLAENQTKENKTARKRGLAIPQGIGKVQFYNAIDELSQQLGAANVLINDQPLEDGW